MTHLPSCANSIWIVLTKVHCSFSCKRRAADEEIVESEKIGPIKRMKHFFANIECDNLSLDFDSVLHNLYFWGRPFYPKTPVHRIVACVDVGVVVSFFF